MNICLTGATGYLGQHLAKQMNNRGIKPIVLARRWDYNFSIEIKTKEVYKVDFTNAISLNQKLIGVDVVISTLGITRQKDDLTYMDVDYQGNLNLLNEAKRCNVKKFIYVSALNADKLKNIKICEAKEKFVDELKKSGLEYLIIRPNGFFSDMKDFLDMANSGRVYLFGKGDKKLNPIHGVDLANFCLDSITLKNKELEIGGPQIFSHEEIAELAFYVLGKKRKITYIPEFFRKIILKLLPIFSDPKTYGPIEFFLSAMGIDMIAPKFGQYYLEDFYTKQVKGVKMDINTKYEEHMSIVKKLKYDESFYEVREPFKENFQKIHDDAKEKGINVSNAKEYLRSLSKEELSTLQNYTLLVNEIEVDILSDEGAYNLLLEHYEKYDFNNDGFIEDGVGKGTPIIPSHFSNTEKKALVDTFNSMEPGNMLSMASLLLAPMKLVDGEIVSDPKRMQFDDIQKRVETILNPLNEKYSTQEFKDGSKLFWEKLMKNYSQIFEQKVYYGIKN